MSDSGGFAHRGIRFGDEGVAGGPELGEDFVRLHAAEMGDGKKSKMED